MMRFYHIGRRGVKAKKELEAEQEKLKERQSIAVWESGQTENLPEKRLSTSVTESK